MKLEHVLSSRGRVRVLKVLLRVGELNVSEIARRSGLNYATANNHLEALERAGLLREKRFGRIRIYRVRDDDERLKQFRRLVDVWETLNPASSE
ncbi:MAG: ArsR/SmtB family transcription factor [Candidatus Bathyarchaeia archaeon]